MATWTEATLAEKVLSYLGAKAQGQNPSADDLDLVTAAIDSLVDGLRPTGAVTFALTAIPEWAQLPLVEIVASRVGPNFGRPRDPELEKKARAELIGGSNGAPSLDPAKARYF